MRDGKENWLANQLLLIHKKHVLPIPLVPVFDQCLMNPGTNFASANSWNARGNVGTPGTLHCQDWPYRNCTGLQKKMQPRSGSLWNIQRHPGQKLPRKATQRASGRPTERVRGQD